MFATPLEDLTKTGIMSRDQMVSLTLGPWDISELLSVRNSALRFTVRH